VTLSSSSRVFLAQFLKSRDHSELAALARFPDLVTPRQYGSGSFVRGAPSPQDFDLAKRGLDEVREALLSGEYQLVVMDEANVALRYGLLGLADILELLENKPDGVELVITGRGAPPELIEKADLVTEMREIKHYFKAGVSARTGIEK